MLGHLLYSKQLGLDPRPDGPRHRDRPVPVRSPEGNWIIRMAGQMMDGMGLRAQAGRTPRA